ncbi:hypothetical protein MtrunA17_Chr2g0322471 [Medicago truncatula]|uniref:Uncharacterized protein n=1 Tax=Medicago truncatula TaxID=3880 RepID=A2Q4I3_MEDTR|nr:hypothetical protein MtrDRAFT_AC157488g15v2 [Medicago truncatula]RHN75551.1 hypothetical protein MtrunA17_Chr2g0322471 [Medicago truncatula]
MVGASHNNLINIFECKVPKQWTFSLYQKTLYFASLKASIHAHEFPITTFLS